MLDLIIKNGQCYIDGELKNLDVAIKDGKIQQIGKILEILPSLTAISLYSNFPLT